MFLQSPSKDIVGRSMIEQIQVVNDQRQWQDIPNCSSTPPPVVTARDDGSFRQILS